MAVDTVADHRMVSEADGLERCSEDRLTALERRIADLERGLTDLVCQVDVLANRPVMAAPVAHPQVSAVPSDRDLIVDPLSWTGSSCATGDWRASLPATDVEKQRPELANVIGQTLIDIMHRQVADPGPADGIVISGLARQTARLAALVEKMDRAASAETSRDADNIKRVSGAIDRLSSRLDALEAGDRLRGDVTASVSGLAEVLIGRDQPSASCPLPSGGVFGALFERLDRIAESRASPGD